jgi:prepilin-type processing-associated H-X9-DG protein
MMKKQLFAIVVMLCAVHASAVTVDLSTPEKTIRSFIACVHALDLKSAITCVKDGKFNESIESAQSVLKTGSFSCKLTKLIVKIKGNQAIADATTESLFQGIEKKQSCRETVNLVKVGKKWLIREPDSAPKGNSIINSFVIESVAGKLKSEMDQDTEMQMTCLNNLKQASLAIIMFITDNSEVFKFDAKTWTQSIEPYLKTKTILTCPLDKPGVVSYSLNPAVCGKKFTELAEPIQTVLAYEGQNGKLLFRHKGRAAVAFTDGHVKLIDAEAAKTLRWKP